MDKHEEFALNPWEKLRSRLNGIFLTSRQGLAFSRAGYREMTTEAAVALWKGHLDPLAQRAVADIEREFATAAWREFANLESYRKNLATLWILQTMFSGTGPVNVRVAIDAGTQDFARAPALTAFLRRTSPFARLTGIELDAYPPLMNGHSRFDIARHFCQHVEGARYVAGNFFEWKDPADFASCFYPFVSPHPALAWGLPKHFGDARAWAETLVRVLRPGAFALVVHQGDWEEAEFDEARAAFARELALQKREELRCPFYPARFTAQVSLYKRV